ncbi:Hypothetical_protein [Hexamita inflata]|uniref:Hypothetical_protein n=1 Tax=Hexamita inflata TaxID=28002 RepID=A0AA86URK9_9EUKA|nr:Hypothetical protein HINF_LOCUS52994 [Hexamita inflata]
MNETGIDADALYKARLKSMEQLEDFLSQHQELVDMIENEESTFIPQNIPPDVDQQTPPQPQALSQKTFTQLKKLVNLMKNKNSQLSKHDQACRLVSSLRFQRVLSIQYLQNYYSDRLQTEAQVKQTIDITRPHCTARSLQSLRVEMSNHYQTVVLAVEAQLPDFYQPYYQEEFVTQILNANLLVSEYNYNLKFRYLLSQLYFQLYNVNKTDFQLFIQRCNRIELLMRQNAKQKNPEDVKQELQLVLNTFGEQAVDYAQIPVLTQTLRCIYEKIQTYILFYFNLPASLSFCSVDSLIQILGQDAHLEAFNFSYRQTMQNLLFQSYHQILSKQLAEFQNIKSVFQIMDRAYINLRVISGQTQSSQIQDLITSSLKNTDLQKLFIKLKPHLNQNLLQTVASDILSAIKVPKNEINFEKLGRELKTGEEKTNFQFFREFAVQNENALEILAEICEHLMKTK